MSVVCSGALVEAVRWSQRAATRRPQPLVATARRNGDRRGVVPRIARRNVRELRPTSDCRRRGQPTRVLPARELHPVARRQFLCRSPSDHGSTGDRDARKVVIGASGGGARVECRERLAWPKFIRAIVCQPPIVIARLGGSSTPAVAYRWVASPYPRNERDTVVEREWSLDVRPDGFVRSFQTRFAFATATRFAPSVLLSRYGRSSANGLQANAD